MFDQEFGEDVDFCWLVLVVLVCDVDGECGQLLVGQYWYQFFGDDIVVNDVKWLDQDVEFGECCCVDYLFFVCIEYVFDCD